MIKTIVDFFKGDPEKIRVTKKLLEKLDNLDNWEVVDDGYVRHKIHNIKVRDDRFAEPDHMWIPFWWHRKIKNRTNKIYRKNELDKLSFIYDNLDEKYPLNIFRITDEQRAWLKENATEDQYIEYGNNIYISDETLAMGYKLQWM